MSDRVAVARKHVRRGRTVEPVPDDAFFNQQLNLFQGFLSNTDDDRDVLSNAIDLWDSIPRYSISRLKMNGMRTAEGFLEVAEIPFNYRGQPLLAVIYPARIKDREGRRVSYYPSAREELIEHALRKLATERQAGFFDRSNYRSGTRFSLHQLRRELEQKGHSLRYDELVEGLDILSLGSIEILGPTGDGVTERFARSSYLAALAGVRRRDLDADPDAKWIAQFHPLVTDSINQLTYRQFNYFRLMKCRTQLARWLLNQLVLKYTQAALTNHFVVRASTVRRDSALLNGYKRERDAIAALDEAWAEIQAQGAIYNLRKDEQRGVRGRLEEVTYTAFPSREFVVEQKASNRRLTDARAADAAAAADGRVVACLAGLGPLLEPARERQGHALPTAAAADDATAAHPGQGE